MSFAAVVSKVVKTAYQFLSEKYHSEFSADNDFPSFQNLESLAGRQIKYSLFSTMATLTDFLHTPSLFHLFRFLQHLLFQ